MTTLAGNSPAHAHGRVYAGLVLTMFFWGSAFATSKMLVLEVLPEVGAVLRFGFGSLLMMAILFRRSANPTPARADWGRLAAVALVGVGLVNRPGEGRIPLRGRGSPASP
jgi:drug/metabolite transporter (DMT)-like permease